MKKVYSVVVENQKMKKIPFTYLLSFTYTGE